MRRRLVPGLFLAALVVSTARATEPEAPAPRATNAKPAARATDPKPNARVSQAKPGTRATPAKPGTHASSAKPGTRASSAKPGARANSAKSSARPVAAAHLARLSAAQIVERNVRARGGLERWRAVGSLKMSGEMDAGGTADPKLPFVLSLKRPRKSRLELTFAGKSAVQTYDGAQGWKVRPFLNRDDVEPFTAAEARAAASFTELDGPLVDHVKKGTRVELAGTERVEGKSTYKLKLTSRSGEQRFVWVDGTTFLEAKISGEPRKLDGRPHDVAIYFRDYRTVDGLTMPYALETAVEGVRQRQQMTIRTVTVNAPLDDALFAKPTLASARTPRARPTP